MGAGCTQAGAESVFVDRVADVLWVEQPVGTGFTQGMPNATGEEDVAEQFLGLEGRETYVTGESYAGYYVPYIVSHALIQRSCSLTKNQ